MKKRVHFIGVGGIALSALAQWYKKNGWEVTGSDVARSEITDALRKSGIKVIIGAHHVPAHTEKVIYTRALEAQNPELRTALKKNIPCFTDAQAIAEIARDRTLVAITGAHGKSTTTALIALAFIRAGLDPTVFIGTKLKEFANTNFRSGRSRYVIAEADDFAAKFLAYHPHIAIVTNIDREHLDYYKNIGQITQSFEKFLSQIPDGGIAILNRDDPRLKKIGERIEFKKRIRVAWYAKSDPVAREIKRVLKIPGDHNLSNAVAAFTAAQVLGLPKSKVLSALASFKGAWRRFDYRGVFHGAQVIADYAHHPTEIKATIAAAHEKFPQKKIWCIFQPHQRNRTEKLFKEFATAFAGSSVGLLDIYEVRGRETKNNSAFTSKKLAQTIKNTDAHYVGNETKLRPFLAVHLRKGDILLMMGAGSIWEMTKNLLTKPKSKAKKSKLERKA